MNDKQKFMITEEYIIENHCKELCPFYEKTLDCNSSRKCPYYGLLKKNNIDKTFWLVDKKRDLVNPEDNDITINSNNIIGIAIRRYRTSNNYICMSLHQSSDRYKWCTDNNLEIQTTLDDAIINLRTMSLLSPSLELFPAQQICPNESFLGSSVDYLEIQRNIKKIKTIIEKYNLKSNIDFSDTFGTSSTGYDEYVCGLRLGSNVVNCCYNRDFSFSILPMFLI
jgi:hypothetical protein